MVGEHLLDELGRFEGDVEILQAWRDGMAPAMRPYPWWHAEPSGIAPLRGGLRLSRP